MPELSMGSHVFKLSFRTERTTYAFVANADPGIENALYKYTQIVIYG